MIPERKHYQLKYETRYWYVLFDFLQATLAESNRFDVLVEQKRITEWRGNFIDNYAKVYPKGIYKYLPRYKKKILNTVLANNIDLYRDVISKRNKGYESIYIWVKIENKHNRRAFPNGEFLTTAKEMKIEPHILSSVYTKEQYLRMIDWIAYKSFESSKDTWKYNNSALSTLVKTEDSEFQRMKDLVKMQADEWAFGDLEVQEFSYEL